MTTLVLQAYEAIKGKIISCEYPPGVLLNEADLIAGLQLTRMPMRDALHCLACEGWVEIRPKKGILVKPIHAEDINYVSEGMIMGFTHVIAHYAHWIDRAFMRDLHQRMDRIWHLDSANDDLEENMSMINALCAELYSYLTGIAANDLIRGFLASLLERKQRLLNMMEPNFTANYFFNYFQAPKDSIDLVQALMDGRYQDAIEYLDMTLRAESHCLLMVWISINSANDIAAKKSKPHQLSQNGARE